MLWTNAFRGTRAVVTGASSGIGRETALALAALGARVALVARRRRALEEVAQRIAARGGEALVVPADLTRQREVRAALRHVAERFGGLDLVVNNAGVLIPARVTELRAADLRAMLQVNLFGALFVMQEAVRLMRPQEGGGSIVNVASLAGRRGITPLGGYCASKFALVGMTEALRTELHDTSIHVALVMPGVVETPMVARASADPDVRLWPSTLNMPPAWVVWAILAAARFRLIELAVPPGAAALEKLAALVPGLTDDVLHWSRTVTRVITDLLQGRRSRRKAADAARRRQ